MDLGKDYYKILNISKTASNDEIKKSYRKLARKYHPDLNPNNKVAEEKFKDISEAYEVLSNEEARKTYDAGGIDASSHNPHRGPFYSHTQSGDRSRYRDIFRDVGDINFEDIFSRQTSRGTATPLRGEDFVFKMTVDFKDAVLGAEKLITLPNGEKLSVKIPAGVRSGQKLKLSERGGSGYNGGPKGDLYIEMHVTTSLEYKRTGDDLEVEVPLLFSVAILGGTVRVPTVDGTVELNVPPGVSSGTKLRIKEKGIRKKGKPGDLYAIIKVTVPKDITPELRSAIQEWNNAYQRTVSEAK
jgi:DnaJ-class molecular chaperone